MVNPSGVGTTWVRSGSWPIPLVSIRRPCWFGITQSSISREGRSRDWNPSWFTTQRWSISAGRPRIFRCKGAEMSEASGGGAGRELHVLASQDGTIIAAALLADHGSSDPGNVRVRLSPREDQRLVVVPAEAHVLQTHADFHRLITQFHVPHGAQALVRKSSAEESTAPR